MPITSETFYRAECDELKCGSMIPTGEDDATHWTRDLVEETLREPHEAAAAEVELWWFYDGTRTLCPRHAPGARPCGTCENDQGMVRVDGRPPNLPEGSAWSFDYHWGICPECAGVGFHPAPAPASEQPILRASPNHVDGGRDA